MIGAIIGDIVGSRFEFNNYRKKDFDLFTKECKVTDDSIMTLAVAKSIMETEKILKPSFQSVHPVYFSQVEKMSVKFMQEIGRKYPNCGYGGRFKEWVHSQNPQPYNSFGNGAAMRVSPVGFVAQTEKEVTLLSKAVTRVTHNHQEGLKGAEAVAVAVYMAQRGSTKDDIQKTIESRYYSLDFTIDEIRDSYETDLSCQGTVPQAIKAFLESTSFEDAVRTAVSIGGDSDTIAAITGAIAESYYGVPYDLKDQALAYLDSELLSIYYEWEEFYEERQKNKQVSGF